MINTVPMKRITAGEVGKSFMHSWVFNNGRLGKLVADNCGWFTSDYFQYFCSIISIKNKLYDSIIPPKQMGKLKDTIVQSWQHYKGM